MVQSVQYLREGYCVFADHPQWGMVGWECQTGVRHLLHYGRSCRARLLHQRYLLHLHQARLLHLPHPGWRHGGHLLHLGLGQGAMAYEEKVVGVIATDRNAHPLH